MPSPTDAKCLLWVITDPIRTRPGNPLWSAFRTMCHGLLSPLLATSGRPAHRTRRRLYTQVRTIKNLASGVGRIPDARQNARSTRLSDQFVGMASLAFKTKPPLGLYAKSRKAFTLGEGTVLVIRYACRVNR